MVGVRLPDPADPSVASVAERIAALGYDSVWTGELWGADAFIQLATVANTVDIDLGTAIVNVYSRSPAVLAQAAATLDSLAEQTVRLGLGASTPKAISDLHGLAFDRPVRRTHEVVDLVQAFTQGEGRVEYAGEIFEVADFPALDADIPVYNAALGEANRRLTGRLCAGWIPHNIPFPALDDAFDTIASAADAAGRDPDAITVAPYVPTAVADDPAEADAAIRGHLAYYVGSGEGYRRAVARRFPEAADRIALAWSDGDRAAAREAVTPEMIAALGVAGTPAAAREQFYELAASSSIDEPILVPPAGLDSRAVEDTLSAIAPDA